MDQAGGILTLQAALIFAITALTGVVALLWKKVEEQMSKCESERMECQKELRALWTAIYDREAKEHNKVITLSGTTNDGR